MTCPGPHAGMHFQKGLRGRYSLENAGLSRGKYGDFFELSHMSREVVGADLNSQETLNPKGQGYHDYEPNQTARK